MTDNERPRFVRSLSDVPEGSLVFRHLGLTNALLVVPVDAELFRMVDSEICNGKSSDRMWIREEAKGARLIEEDAA